MPCSKKIFEMIWQVPLVKVPDDMVKVKYGFSKMNIFHIFPVICLNHINID